jgi:NAD(P)H-dependent FMN reductase
VLDRKIRSLASVIIVYMVHIKVIVGSTRQGRFSEKIVPWLETKLTATEGITYEVMDLRDYPLPLYDEPVSPAMVKDGAYANEEVRAFAKKIAEADAFLVIAPEYNHGYTAVLKNALDSVYAEWNNKAVAFVSYGSVNGGRVVEQLRQVAVELQMAPIRNALHMKGPWFLLDASGNLPEGALDEYSGAFSGVMTQLLWWGSALKEARAK